MTEEGQQGATLGGKKRKLTERMKKKWKAEEQHLSFKWTQEVQCEKEELTCKILVNTSVWKKKMQCWKQKET